MSEPVNFRKTLREILPIFAISRVLIFLIGSLSSLVITHGKFFYRFPPPDSVISLFNKWDSGWYLNIAENGYFYIPGKESSIGFFPLYPLLIRIFSWIFLSPELTGFIISNTALLLASIYLFKLINLDYGPDTAIKTVFFMLVSPVSFFFSIIYSEGLFVFLAITAMYYARQKKWMVAGILGFFLSLTRIPGVLIFIPLILEYLDLDFKSFKPKSKIKGDIFYLALVPAGLFLFLFYGYAAFGDALVYFHSKSAWHLQLGSFSSTFKSVKYYSSFYNDIFIGALVLAIFLIGNLYFLKARASYIIYSACFLILCLSTGVLEGLPRYVGTIFPLYLGMALLAAKSKAWDYCWTTVSISFLMLFVILFANAYWFT